LKVVMSHTGGALPYQAGRMDKNGKKANLPELRAPTSAYVHRHGVAHALGMEFAVRSSGPIM